MQSTHWPELAASPQAMTRFEAETYSPKYGKLVWKGIVRGRKLDGTMTMVRDGQVAGEKWVVAGEAV